MNTATVIGLGYAAVSALATLAYLRLRRAPKRPYRAARWDDDAQQWVNEEPHNVGPDALQLLEDLETHLKAYGASVADLYDTTTGD